MPQGGTEEERSEEDALADSPACTLQVTEEVIDADILKICAYTVKEARTVKQIASGLKIPLVKCYEIIEWMEEKGLIVESGKVRTSTHGKAKLYISTVKSGSIELYNGKLVIRCVHKGGETRVREEILDKKA